MNRQGAPLGQHFLKNAYYAYLLTQSLGAQKNEIILEIGPGKGMLTRELLKTGARVLAIEKDEALVDILAVTFKQEIESGMLDIISRDIREVTPVSLGLQSGAYTLGANIPYYITGEIIRQFLTSEIQPRTMAILIQKEVAQRIVSSKETLLSLSVKAYGVPRIVSKVVAGNFNPPPSVDSAILAIEHISNERFTDVSEHLFFEVLHTGFASKRKQLLGNLSEKYDRERVAKIFAQCGMDLKIRAEDVHVDEWMLLTKKLST